LAISLPDPAQAEQYLRERLPQVVPGAAVAGVEPLAAEVWQVALEDGRLLVAKHQPWGLLTQGQPWDLLETETEVLGLLAEAGCPVPRVLGSDPQAQFIFFEHCGGLTLEDAPRPAHLPQVAEGLRHIEETLAQHQERLLPRVMPQARPAGLLERWAQATARARWGLEWLAGQGGVPGALAPAGEALARCCAFLAARPPSLGTTDYNPRNIVVDARGGQVRFIEFAKLGWDWTERRLVQYTNTLKPGFGTLLDQDQAHRCAGRLGSGGVRALEYHQLVFWLNAAAMLGRALDAPGENEAQARAWAPLPPRLGQLTACLRLPQSADPWALAIRKVLG
jgi:hypothetical protein